MSGFGYPKFKRKTVTVSQDAPAGGGSSKRSRYGDRRAALYRSVRRPARNATIVQLRSSQYWNFAAGNTGNYGLSCQLDESYTATPGGPGGTWFQSCSAGVVFRLSATQLTRGDGSSTTSTNAQYGEWVNAFKYYRIKKVRLCMTRMDVPTESTWYPEFYLSTDDNHQNTGFASILEMYQQSGTKRFQLGSPSSPNGKQYFTVYPRLMQTVSSTAGDSTIVPAPRGTWISLSNPDVTHYGLQLGWINPERTTGGTIGAHHMGTVHVIYEYEIELKGAA